ncbi:MAG: hypothetical protein GY936_02215 [Ignavibacteriae bacterium]|nr:hypothetical protein [Ignavibacteriota bacterium]
MNDEEIDGKLSSKNWDVSNGGFWREKPYIDLSEPFFYKDEKVILFQYTIIA